MAHGDVQNTQGKDILGSENVDIDEDGACRWAKPSKS